MEAELPLGKSQEERTQIQEYDVSRNIPIESRDSLKDAMNCLPQTFTCVEEYRLMRNLIREAQNVIATGTITDGFRQAISVYNIMIEE